MEFALQTRGAYDHLRTAAHWVQDQGLAALALPDHYLAGRADDGYDTKSSDIYPYLGGLTIETTVPLVALVSPVSYRHPAALLKLGLALDEMSAGRFTLGVGTGWFTAEHSMFGFELPDWPARFDRLEEALGYLAAALGEGSEGFAGEYYRLEPIDHLPKGINLRILIGGSGPRRTPDLAGRFADEFNVYSLPPAELSARIERARQSAAECGRDPDAVAISCAGPPIIGVDTATYRARLEAVARDRRVDIDRLEQGARDIGVPMGTHEEARDTFGPLEGLGVGRYYLQILGSSGLDYAAELVEVLGNA